jgi:kynurenine formamidase
MTDLLDQARDWIAEVHPHAEHLERTLYWALRLDPQASPALRIAAVSHDIERAFPTNEYSWDGPGSWDDPDYSRWHQDRCAEMVGRFLKEHDADTQLVDAVTELVRAHEVGGWPEADILQAADSLSFLEVMGPLARQWVETGRSSRQRAERKVRDSYERIQISRARELAAPLLDKALTDLDATHTSATAVAGGREQVLTAARLVSQGRIYSLARARFRGMPVFPGHPNFEVLSYRTPQGIRNAGDQPWGPENDAGLGYMSELILASAHTGAHIDAHAHMTVGPTDRWHGGQASTDLGDFGPLVGDATEIAPLWRRGVLFDIPAYRGIDFLPRGEPVTAQELGAVERAQETTLGFGDIALIRTGYMRHFPDAESMAANRGPGPDISAARWLCDRGVHATGSDTETYEVQPAPDPGEPTNPQPVHTLLLIEHGIYIMESLDLEALAADGIYEFLFVLLPLKIRGATGSMADPIAVC